MTAGGRSAAPILLGVAFLLAGEVGVAVAQSGPSARRPIGPPRLELSVLGMVATGADVGASDATLIGNTVPTGAAVALFSSRTRIATGPQGALRVGVRLGKGWLAEGGATYGRPQLQVLLSNDIEGAPDVTATSRLTQVVVDAALVHRWDAGRLTPFVLGGGGYLRQLDAPRTTVGTGQVYGGGGGVLLGLGPRRPGGGYRLQARGEVRLQAYRGGLLIVDERPVGFVAGVGLTLAIR